MWFTVTFTSIQVLHDAHGRSKCPHSDWSGNFPRDVFVLWFFLGCLRHPIIPPEVKNSLALKSYPSQKEIHFQNHHFCRGLCCQTSGGSSYIKNALVSFGGNLPWTNRSRLELGWCSSGTCWNGQDRNHQRFGQSTGEAAPWASRIQRCDGLHMHIFTVMKVDGATPTRWRFVRGHEKTNTWELRHLLSRWYTSNMAGNHYRCWWMSIRNPRNLHVGKW